MQSDSKHLTKPCDVVSCKRTLMRPKANGNVHCMHRESSVAGLLIKGGPHMVCSNCMGMNYASKASRQPSMPLSMGSCALMCCGGQAQPCLPPPSVRVRVGSWQSRGHPVWLDLRCAADIAVTEETEAAAGSATTLGGERYDAVGLRLQTSHNCKPVMCADSCPTPPHLAATSFVGCTCMSAEQ